MTEQKKTLVEEYNDLAGSRQGYASWLDFDSQCDRLPGMVGCHVPQPVGNFGGWLFEQLGESKKLVMELRAENEQLRSQTEATTELCDGVVVKCYRKLDGRWTK